MPFAFPFAFSLTEFAKQPTIRVKNHREVAPILTERVRMSFTVKEFSGGQPWICLKPVKEDLIVLANGFLGFDLPVETTIEKVRIFGREDRDRILHEVVLVSGCDPRG
jgi:hypothetical protein